MFLPTESGVRCINPLCSSSTSTSSTPVLLLPTVPLDDVTVRLTDASVMFSDVTIMLDDVTGLLDDVALLLLGATGEVVDAVA